MPKDTKVVIHAEVIFENPKAMRAIERVAELAAELAEDQPWNDDAKILARAARYAMNHIRVDGNWLKR